MFKKITDFFKNLFKGKERQRRGTYATPYVSSNAFDVVSEASTKDSRVSADLDKFLGSDQSKSKKEKNYNRHSQAPSELKKKFKKPRRRTSSTISV